MELYFRWANDPVARENSWNREPISWDAHELWFAGQMADATNAHYIVESEGTPIGQVRFGRDGAEALIGFSLDPSFRGKGLGGKMLLAAIDRYAEEYPGMMRLKAMVKRDNIPSNKIFSALGFRQESDDVTSGFIHRLELPRKPAKD